MYSPVANGLAVDVWWALVNGKLLRRDTSSGAFWSNPPNRILAEGRPGSLGITCGEQRYEFDQISRMENFP